MYFVLQIVTTILVNNKSSSAILWCCNIEIFYINFKILFRLFGPSRLRRGKPQKLLPEGRFVFKLK